MKLGYKALSTEGVLPHNLLLKKIIKKYKKI